MKLKSILLAAMLVVSAGGAMAEDYTAPTVALNGGPVDWTIALGTSHTAGAFTDTYTYTYSGQPALAFGFFANVATTFGQIDFASATLNGQNLGVFNLGPGSASYFSSVPVNGLLTLVINGTTTAVNGGSGIASYAGTLDVTSPVPEPETYGMLLAGLGVVGFLARRRRQAQA